MEHHYHSDPIPQRTTLVRPGLDGAGTRRALEAIEHLFRHLPEGEWNARALAASINDLCAQAAFPLGAAKEALSVAITGAPETATLYPLLAALGRHVALRRLHRAVLELSVVA